MEDFVFNDLDDSFAIMQRTLESTKYCNYYDMWYGPSFWREFFESSSITVYDDPIENIRYSLIISNLYDDIYEYTLNYGEAYNDDKRNQQLKKFKFYQHKRPELAKEIYNIVCNYDITTQDKFIALFKRLMNSETFS